MVDFGLLGAGSVGAFSNPSPLGIEPYENEAECQWRFGLEMDHYLVITPRVFVIEVCVVCACVLTGCC